MDQRISPAEAAKEIAGLCQRILELAPDAGVYVGIKITEGAPALSTTPDLSRDEGRAL